MNIDEIKSQFPIFNRTVKGKPLVYLDSAATSQKPQVVIDALVDYYTNHNANVHRGIHMLGDESTKLYHQARETIARFLGANPNELIFVRNTTEAINLVAYSWVRETFKPGDLIITSELEHHSNIVPWQEAAKTTGAQLTFVDVTADGRVDLEHLEALLESLGSQVKLLSFAHISNATGAVLDVKKVVELKRKYAKHAKILLDGAQSVPHMSVNFSELGIDFLAFSGHKMYGPMGIGGLVVNEKVLNQLNPFLFGGGMIDQVELTGTTFAALPDRFDAGTPNVAGAVGLARACEFLQKLNMEKVEKHGRELVTYATEKLSQLTNITIIGPKVSNHRLGSVTFTIQGVHAHDVAQVLNSEGIAVRSGHHCTMPLHHKLDFVATTRASFGVYNTKADIDALVTALTKVTQIFGV